MLIACMKHACKTHEPHKGTTIKRYEYKFYARVYFHNISVYDKQFFTNLFFPFYINLLIIKLEIFLSDRKSCDR